MKAQIAAILFLLSGTGANGQHTALTADRDNTVYSDLPDTELKPRIKAVNILGKECNTPYASYNLHYTVEYTGCDQLKIQLDEEYGSSLQTTYVKEAPLADITTRYIAAAGYAWIDIIAENQYGKDVYTIELSPCEECYKTPTGIGNIFCDMPTAANLDHMEVYDITGAKVATVRDHAELGSLCNGIYLIRAYDANGNVMQHKYLKR